MFRLGLQIMILFADSFIYSTKVIENLIYHIHFTERNSDSRSIAYLQGVYIVKE